MVFTAVLAAIAVIAAMVTVPGGKAEAAEPTDFVPNETLSPYHVKEGRDTTWGPLVWAGVPEGQPKSKQTGNDVGWGWCIDFTTQDPVAVNRSYHKSTAGALRFDDPKYQDAAIGLAMKLRDATKAGDKKLTANYSVYLAALISDGSGRTEAVRVIRGGSAADPDRFKAFTGSEEEFASLTGLRIVSDTGQKGDIDTMFEADPSVTIESQPADAFITIVGPDGNWNIRKGFGQRVVPVDQPGLPDDGGSGSNPSGQEPSIKTEAKFAEGSTRVVNGAVVTDTVTYEGLVVGKKYHLDAKLMSKDGKTVLGTGEAEFTPESADGETTVDIKVDNAEKPVESAVAFEELTSTEVESNGDETPNNETPNKIAEHKDLKDEAQTVDSKETTEPTKPTKPTEPTGETTEPTKPTTEEHKPGEPKVSTNADFEGGLREVVAGAKVVDQVSYEGLVPGKEYALDAQLISKEDGKTVLGETKGHKFTPESANGTEAVTIVVDDSVTEPVEAAVAFETLTSTQVDKHGEDNPTDEDNPNPVGEHKDINDDDQTVTSEDSEKTPKVSTNADFEKGSHAVVAGAKIVDEVTYEGLVPGKQYTLKAELINKKDGKSVLGTGEKTFTPEKSKGMVPVTITVNDDVKEPVQAAVAFEELTSTEVNDKGEETPGTTSEKPNHIAEHKDINDDDQTVISHEVHDQDKPGGSSDGSSNGSSNGSSDGSSDGSSKDSKWWLILIPGIGLGKIIKDHFDHKDHGNHNGGHGDNTGNHDGGNGKHTDGHNGGNGHEVKGQDAPQGGNSDNGHGRGVEVQGQEPEETGNALPSNAERVEIKSVPSGATELEPGMQDYIK